MRQIVMVGFLQAQNCTNLVTSWRHPASRTDSYSPEYYRHIGRVLEAGKFHLGFFDDRLAMPDRFGGDHAHTVQYGIRCVKMDPIAVLMTMGMATERLGLGATCSTTYFEPFHVARQFTVVAETKAEAEDKMALNDELFEEVDTLSLLSEAMNFDFASKDLDEPFTDEELDNISGTQSMRDRVQEASGIRNPTVRDFMTFSRRARPRYPIVGGPKDVADGLEAMFSGRACDGFVLAADNIPGTYEDFVRLVVPELQRRGLYHKDYTGATLRENLGLPYPQRSDWKR